MAQFDVFKNPRGGLYPLLLDVQTDTLARLTTRIVVPLVQKKKYDERPITRLNPTVAIAGVDYVLLFQAMASAPASILSDRVASLDRRRPDLIAAIDLLFTGT